MRTVGRKAAVAASAIAIAGLGMGVLGACGSGSSSDASSQVTSNPNANNQQDAIFANQTIVLNEQLVVLTDVLSAKAKNSAVAAKIEDLGRVARERIVLADGWLVSWGRSNSEAPDPAGLLSARQITAVTVATGSNLASAVDAAVTQYLAATIGVSDAELASGVNPDAREFAQAVKDSAASDLAVLTTVTS
jgi:uncharacterized protein (DUF305 family)